MLWYKTWRETRTRFWIAAAALAWVCLAIILTSQGNRTHEIPPLSYSAYIWKAVYKNYVRDLFTVLVIVLGGGGLLQERAHGTEGFTLALPVSRSRLMFVRAAVGLAEVILLALVPAIVISTLSPLTGERYPWPQALQFSVLWTGGGAVVFGGAVLLSTLLAGEYSGWIVCFLCVMVYSAAVNITTLEQYPRLDIFKMMSGARMSYLNTSTYFLEGQLPWLPLGILVAIAAGFIFGASRISERQDHT